jgi:hypothetical protein
MSPAKPGPALGVTPVNTYLKKKKDTNNFLSIQKIE